MALDKWWDAGVDPEPNDLILISLMTFEWQHQVSHDRTFWWLKDFVR